MYQRILVLIDICDLGHFKRSIEPIIDWARVGDSSVRLLAVIRPTLSITIENFVPRDLDAREGHQKQDVQKSLLALAMATGLESHRITTGVLEGGTLDAIDEAKKMNADLVVVCSSTRLLHFWGSGYDVGLIIRHAPCPVLISAAHVTTSPGLRKLRHRSFTEQASFFWKNRIRPLLHADFPS